MNEQLKQKKFLFTTPLDVEGQPSEIMVTLDFNYLNQTFKGTGGKTTK